MVGQRRLSPGLEATVTVDQVVTPSMDKGEAALQRLADRPYKRNSRVRVAADSVIDIQVRSQIRVNHSRLEPGDAIDIRLIAHGELKSGRIDLFGKRASLGRKSLRKHPYGGIAERVERRDIALDHLSETMNRGF